MAHARTAVLLQQVRKLAADGSAGAQPDGQLLERFTDDRDETAFAALVQRHGAMVHAVCRSVLRHEQDAEDACQATFLILARKAPSIRRRESVGSWLHEVAYRVALRAKARAPHLPATQPPERAAADDPVLDLTLRDVQRVVHEELRRLPEQYRAPLVLCYLEARTQDEAARLLGCTEAALRGRLHRGRELLRGRLGTRGLSLAAGLLPPLLSEAQAALAPALLTAATRAATTAPPPPRVVELAAEALRSGSLGRVRCAALALFTLAFVGITAAGQLTPQAPKENPVPVPAAAQAAPDVKPAPADVHGDPLPPGALARIGTVRLRHPGGLSALAYSPDSKMIASVGAGTLRLWDAATGKEVRRFDDYNHFRSAEALLFSPDGKTLAVAGDSPIRLWDVATGKEAGKLGGYLVDVEEWRRKFAKEFGRNNYVEPPHEGHRRRVWSLAFTADGNTAVSAGGDLLVWDLKKKRLSRTLLDAKHSVAIVAVSGDGKTLAAVSSANPGVAYQSRVLSFWDLAAGKELSCIPDAHKEHINCLALSPDGRLAATGGTDHKVRVWDVEAGQEARVIHVGSGGSTHGVAAVAFSPDGKSLAATAFPSEVRLWDAATGKELRRFGPHEGVVTRFAFSPDGKTLAMPNFGVIRLWDVSTGKPRLEQRGNDGGLPSVAFAPGGLRPRAGVPLLATTGGDRTIRVWEALTGKEILRIKEDQSWMSSVTFTADGKAVVSRTYEYGKGYQIGVWDIATGKLERRLGKHPTVGLSLAGVGKTVVAGSGEELAVWDVAAGRELHRLTGHKKQAYSLTRSFDGARVAAIDAEGEVLLWDAVAGRLLGRWPRDKALLCRAALSPDGKLLAVGDQDGWVRLWDTDTGSEVRRFQAHRATAIAYASPRALEFSPGGDTLLSGGYEGTLVLWEVTTARERKRFEGHQCEVNSVSWVAEGTAFASASNDGTVLVWDVTGRLHAGRLRSLRLTAERLRELWGDLADRDARRAHAAVWELAAGAQDALPFLAERLRPVPAERAQHEKWIGQLDDARFAVRQEATAQLERCGKVAQPALRAALRGKSSLEVRKRVEQLLELLSQAEPAPELLRELRAIEALRNIEAPAVADMLRRIAGGAKGAPQTDSAKLGIPAGPLGG